MKYNGRLYEAIVARREGRPPRDLYHAALEVRLDGTLFVIESAPIPDGDGPAARGVVLEGPVGARWAGALRLFRYEVRCWPGGEIPDREWAVGGARRVSGDPAVARRVLDLALRVPPLVWGRDELCARDMWNSNSIVAWLLAHAGVDAGAITPPSGGRAPGWRAGLTAAGRATAAHGRR